MKVTIQFHDNDSLIVTGAESTAREDDAYVVRDADNDQMAVVPWHNIKHVTIDYDE